MDEEEFIIWINDLEERTKKQDKQMQRKRLITNFVIGCLPGMLFCIWLLWVR